MECLISTRFTSLSLNLTDIDMHVQNNSILVYIIILRNIAVEKNEKESLQRRNIAVEGFLQHRNTAVDQHRNIAVDNSLWGGQR